MSRLDGNKLRSPGPNEPLGSSVEEAIKLGHNQFIDENGVVQKMRYKSRASLRNGLRYEIEPLATRNANRGSDARRASINQQSITLEDYQDFARRNGYSQEEAVQLYNYNEAKLKELRGGKSKLINYEHLLPSRSPLRGGLEHYRNIVLMASEQNAIKSDYLASVDAAVKAGVPLTKSAAIKADFEGRSLPPDQVRINTILDDIAGQPSPKTSRDVRKALTKNPQVVSEGEKFRLIDDFTPAQRRALNSAPDLASKEQLIRRFRNLPGLGLMVGGGLAATQLMQGKPAQAAETVFDTAVSEIPIVGDVLEPAPTANATLQGRTDPQAYAAQYKQERQKAKQEQSSFITDTLKLIKGAL